MKAKPKGRVVKPEPRVARLAAILLWVFAAIAIGAFLLYLQSVNNIHSGGILYVAPLVVIAAVVLLFAYAIIRRLKAPLIMIGVVVPIYMVTFASTSYDFVSSMSQVSMFILAPLVLAAVIMILTDAYKLLKKHPNIMRSNRMRTGVFITALLGSVVSLGFGLFMVSLALSLRACELSGSSKCM